MIWLMIAGFADEHSSKNDFLASAVWSGRKPCLFFFTILKKDCSAEWHSSLPLLSVVLPYRHKTTSQASAALIGDENISMLQIINVGAITLFISVTIMDKCVVGIFMR
jgi:hypothetical protein